MLYLVQTENKKKYFIILNSSVSFSQSEAVRYYSLRTGVINDSLNVNT